MLLHISLQWLRQNKNQQFEYTKYTPFLAQAMGCLLTILYKKNCVWDVFLRFCIKKKSCVIKAPHCTYILVTEKINAYKNSSNESGMTRQISQQRMTFFNSWFISVNYELQFRFQAPYIFWNNKFDMISDKYILYQGTLCIHNIYRNIHP